MRSPRLYLRVLSSDSAPTRRRHAARSARFRAAECALAVELGEGGEEGAEEDEGVLNVTDADGLPDRVHGPAARANIDGTQPLRVPTGASLRT